MQPTEVEDEIQFNYNELGLDAYYKYINDSLELSKKEDIQNDNIIKILSDAIDNYKNAIYEIKYNWEKLPSFVDEEDSCEEDKQYLQIHYCQNALFGLYSGFKEKLKNINSPKYEKIINDLRNIGIIE